MLIFSQHVFINFTTPISKQTNYQRYSDITSLKSIPKIKKKNGNAILPLNFQGRTAGNRNRLMEIRMDGVESVTVLKITCSLSDIYFFSYNVE